MMTVPKLGIAESEEGTVLHKSSVKTKRGMSLGSGYLTPSERDGSEYIETEGTRVTIQSESLPKKQAKIANETYHTPRSLKSKVLCKLV